MLKELFKGIAEWQFCMSQIIGPSFAMEKLTELMTTGKFSIHYLRESKAEELAALCFKYGLHVKVTQTVYSMGCKDVDVTLIPSVATE